MVIVDEEEVVGEGGNLGGVWERFLRSVSLRRSYSILRGGLRLRGGLGKALGGSEAPRSFRRGGRIPDSG